MNKLIRNEDISQYSLTDEGAYNAYKDTDVIPEKIHVTTIL